MIKRCYYLTFSALLTLSITFLVLNRYPPHDGLKFYSQSDFVVCLEERYGLLLSGPIIHVAFVGDSRIRQQFHGFCELIPDYDWEMSHRIPKWDKTKYEIQIHSRLLRLRISYHWNPLIDESLDQTLRKLIDSRPEFILIGIQVHHMLHTNQPNHLVYQDKLRSILKRLASVGTRVLWLEQYPVVEIFGKNGSFNVDVHSAKIHQYNVANRLLIDERIVRIWDDGLQLAGEYVRSCRLLMRYDYAQYLYCDDFIHTGYNAIYEATQLLINNHFCAGGFPNQHK